MLNLEVCGSGSSGVIEPTCNKQDSTKPEHLSVCVSVKTKKKVQLKADLKHTVPEALFCVIYRVGIPNFVNCQLLRIQQFTPMFNTHNEAG